MMAEELIFEGVRLSNPGKILWPEQGLTKADLGARAGYQPSGTLDRYLSSLRSLRLLETELGGP